jgi:hypothetical protein
MDVFQCPVCALKFRFSSELDQHLKLEHPKFSAEDDDAGDAALRERERKKRDLKP